MSKKIEMLELPVLPAGMAYVAMPESVDIYVDCNGRVDKTFTIDVPKLIQAARTAALKTGLGRILGTAPTSAGKDESDLEATERRFADLTGPNYTPGAGGGARKSEYERQLDRLVVMVAHQRESDTGCKNKTMAVKFLAESDDSAHAYLRILEAVAAKHEGFDATAQFDKLWPGFESKARKAADVIEAARRDADMAVDDDGIEAGLAA